MKALKHDKVIISRSVLLMKVLIIVWPLLFIWQGIDLTDTGYILTGGQQVFIEPENVQFSYLLSFVLAGLWNGLTASLGLMGTYLGSAVVYILTALIVYRVLRGYMSERILLLGLLMSMMVPNLMRYINYNNLTALFFVIGSAFLVKAFSKRSLILYFLAGCVFGLSFYLRLPNIVSYLMFTAILAGHLIDGNKRKETFRQVSFYSAGFITALIVPFLFLVLYGLEGQYIDTFRRILDILTDPASHHSGKGLLKLVINDMDRIFIAFLQSFLILLLLGKGYDRLKNRYLKSALIFAPLVLIVMIGAGLVGTTSIYHYYIFALTGFILSIQIFGYPRAVREIRFASLVALLVLIFSMAGSNTGISAARYDLWLVFPLVLHGLFSLDQMYLGEILKDGSNMSFQGVNGLILFSRSSMNMVRRVVCISIVLFMVILCYRFSYKDSEKRYELIHNVDHPRMKYVFTTRERATVLTEALKELSRYVMPGDYLLSLNYIPLFHYLTDTKPYLYHSWPELYSPELLIRQFKKAIKEREKPPFLIRAKYPPLNHFWPEEKIKGTSETAHMKIYEEFILQGKYTKAWENDFFEIFLPPVSWR